MPDNEPPEDETPRASKAKLFDLGADTEPVILSGEDANIGDAIDTFNGLERARRAARRPGNERFVKSLKKTFQEKGPGLKEALAGVVLADLREEVKDYLEDTLSGDDSKVLDDADEETAEALQASRLLSIEGEEVSFTDEAQRRSEEWQDGSFPEPLLDIAEAFLDGQDWGGWAEWGAPHVIYWNRRELVEQIEDEGGDPERMSDEEWHRRFNERLESEMERHVSDLTEIMVLRMSEVLLESIHNATSDGTISLRQLDGLLGLDEDDEDDAPAPRPETPDYNPDPFTGPNETAWLLGGRFQNGVKDSLLEADGEPAETRVGEWGLGPDDAPVRVEKLDGGNSPYEGRATLKVQARADADPAEVEAAMGWEILERVDMDTVWLHLLLLAHASAPHRRGERQVMTIPRKRVKNVLGFHRGDGKSVEKRAEEVEQHVKALQSIYVRFQGVKRHGERTRLTNQRNATPLWNIQMVEHADLFENSVRRDWVLKVKEGLWGEEFLHEWEKPQWTPLPKEWFDQIDRRGKDWTQRLAVYLLFHFRRNVEDGAVVNLNAGTMLDICGADTGGRSQRKTERKKRLSSALDALRDQYGIGVQAERVHMRHTKGMSTENWKTNSVTFYPPDEMSGELFRNESDGRPPLPDVKGNWTKDQINQLRTDLGWSQTKMAEYLDVSQGYVSQLESGRATPPSDEKCKLLDRLDSRRR
ncbi:DNA-binding transcriptional regulator YiaG [Salinibacter ruber]|uniref:helix-turn-helix domain-containing protein n=1 Tax=Salinibacter ruber TaxID=146919 RepID=UPI002169195E|nr:helix-turn-helix transcriptional regulator [Salinibacter ruber]MCS4048186.1 DNA-binding transcriptional regulator YiaG [Salinibacter ruber]